MISICIYQIISFIKYSPFWKKANCLNSENVLLSVSFRCSCCTTACVDNCVDIRMTRLVSFNMSPTAFFNHVHKLPLDALATCLSVQGKPPNVINHVEGRVTGPGVRDMTHKITIPWIWFTYL